MIYLDFFTFPDSDMEFDFFLSQSGHVMIHIIPFRFFQNINSAV